MKITLNQIVVWLAAGALAGWLVGMLVTRTKQGFGRWGNFGVGLIGALIGGAIFRLFNIDLGLGELAISLQDLLSAFLGSFIFLGAVWLIRRREKTRV